MSVGGDGSISGTVLVTRSTWIARKRSTLNRNARNIVLCENICYYKQMLYHSRAKLERKKKARIATRYDLSGRPTADEKVRRLLRAEPNWGQILRECIIAAGQRKSTKGSVMKFAGAWVMQGLRAQGITPPNNLRTLSSIGIVKLVATTRAGNRAYYTIPDTKGVGRALKDLGY
jgi:hypothetical protein